MPLVAIEEDQTPDTCSDSGDARSINREFIVYFTAGTGEGSIDARLAVPLHKGEVHPRDPLSRVGNVSAKLHRSITQYTPPEFPTGVISCTSWRVVVSYSTDEENKYENPCDRPPERDWDTIEIETAVDKAWDYETNPEEPTYDVPLVNTVGDSLQGVTEPEYIWVFTWSKNLPKKQWNPLVYQDWLNATNKGDWQGFDDNKCKFATIRWQEQDPVIVDRKMFEWGTLLVQIQIKQRGSWARELLNVGFRYKTYVEGQGDKIRNIEIDGVPVSSPQLLNAEGGLIPPEDINSGDASPHYLSFQTVEKKDFNDFPVEVTVV